MVAVVSLLIVISVSFLIIRIGAVALTMTGVSDDIARFQALSAFSGAGFTTGESENVVNGSARRRIVAWLIRAGSAGVVTAISSLILSFIGGGEDSLLKLIILGAGVIVIVMVARSQRLDQLTRPLIKRLLEKSTALDLRDYAGLLRLRDDWRVGEIEVTKGSWLAGGSLRQLSLKSEDVTVLGIERPDGSYQGTPDADTRPEAGDTLILYGKAERIKELSNRQEGDDAAHASAVADSQSD